MTLFLAVTLIIVGLFVYIYYRSRRAISITVIEEVTEKTETKRVFMSGQDPRAAS